LQLESGSGDAQKKADELSRELDDCKLQVQQLDAKNKSLHSQIESQETQKRQLEDEMDALNAKLANVNSSGEKNEDLQQQHQKLVAQLRDQIALKNSQIKELTVCFLFLLTWGMSFLDWNFLIRTCERYFGVFSKGIRFVFVFPFFHHFLKEIFCFSFM